MKLIEEALKRKFYENNVCFENGKSSQDITVNIFYKPFSSGFVTNIFVMI